jgi:hypothetical protein
MQLQEDAMSNADDLLARHVSRAETLRMAALAVAGGALAIIAVVSTVNSAFVGGLGAVVGIGTVLLLTLAGIVFGLGPWMLLGVLGIYAWRAIQRWRR